MTPSQEPSPRPQENTEGSGEMDPVEVERRAIDARDEAIDREIYLCDREGTNFYVVAQGIKIPPELQEKVMTAEVRALLERVFAFNQIEQPEDLFSQTGGQIAKDALRKYEDNLWEERRQLNDRLGELSSETDGYTE